MGTSETTRDIRAGDGASWLCAGAMERRRMLDMDRRIAPVRAAALAVLGVALLVSAPWLGLWTLVPLIFAAGLFVLADRWGGRSERPEYALFAAWAGAQVSIAGATALVDGPEVATLSWLAIPVVTLSARFNIRGIATGVAFTLVLLMGVALTDWSAVTASPPILIAPAALIVATAMLSTALMRSDIEYRSEALVDPLTGMLTRRALEERAEELAHQSRLESEPVGVIVGDLDQLKELNDRHGHPAGDEALRSAARGILAELRAFDLAYRVGGDEFVVLLPGSGLEQAREMAERLGAAVPNGAEDGIPLSMSFGFDASAPGEVFDFDEVYRRADAKLIEVKRKNRHGALQFPGGLAAAGRE
jgi:diguanylate cyclase (GGDEF)-like protein